jgi:hypothetical protein
MEEGSHDQMERGRALYLQRVCQCTHGELPVSRRRTNTATCSLLKFHVYFIP